MAVNTIGDFIKSVFPTIVNKNGKTFKALLTDGNGGGTVEKVFTDLDETRKAWTDNCGLYCQKGEQLQKTLSVISVLKQLQNESEETFLKRNELLFYRNGNKIWGTKYDILSTFKAFFNNENVYLVNNSERFADSLLLDGNFERQNAWQLNGASYEREAKFEETTGVLFNAGGSCEQSVEVEQEKAYFLHFFLQGNIRVQIIDNHGRYWNPSAGEVGNWQSKEHFMSFDTEKWAAKSVYFISDDRVSTVTIRFVYAPGYYAFLDYVRLHKKTRASTFSLIAVFEGVVSDETSALAPGKDDDIIAPDYENMGYFSPGEIDAKEIKEDSLSYEDIEPLEGYENMTYNDETKALAPVSPNGNDDIKTVDYEKMSYFDNSFVFGATGKAAEEVYQELLDIVQPAGITGTIEILIKEGEEE